MSRSPLVSVIIAAYNVEKYVAEAVDSVLNQTYKNIEIIVVDDGSTDSTREALEPYIKQNKIKYIYQENKRLAAARNTGLRISKGEYIAILDSDDLFLPEKIEKQVDFLENHPECDVCYCDIYHFYEEDPEKMLKLNYTYYSGAEVFKNLLRKNFINPLTVVMRRSAFDRFGEFDEMQKRTEDWEFWARIAWQGANFQFLPEILAKYRMRRTSLTYDWSSDNQLYVFRIFKKLYKEMNQEERKKYHMKKVILRFWLKLQYAKYLARNFVIFRKFQLWLRSRRLKSA